MMVGFLDILIDESTGDDSTESSVESSEPGTNNHSNEQASRSEIEVDGLVTTETDDLDNTETDDLNTQTDVHNSKGIVDCENVENDNVEPDNHEKNPQNDHQKVLPPHTPLQRTTVSAKRSPLAELLVYPTPTQKASKAKSCARVLTSAESIALLEEKARKKREEQEEKERRKRERELKKAAKEEEKKRKAQERQSKQAEKQKKAEQPKSSGQKRNGSSEGSKSKRQQLDREEDGVQHREVSQNECAACFGLFEDDTEPVEWIECTNEDCRVWSHADCLEKCDNAYVCVACQALLA